MRWLNRLPNSTRSPSGLEYALWRKLPWLALLGSALPLLALGLAHGLADGESAHSARALQLADYLVAGVLLFHWTLVLTVGIGCVVVMLMKGPAYVADGLPVSHSDQPANCAPPKSPNS